MDMEHSKLTRLPHGWCNTCERPKEGSLATCERCGADTCDRCGFPSEELCIRCAIRWHAADCGNLYFLYVECGVTL